MAATQGPPLPERTGNAQVDSYLERLYRWAYVFWFGVTDNGIGITPIASGGTGSDTAIGARDNLGLEIGVDIQAYSPNLDEAVIFFAATDITGAEAEDLTAGDDTTLHFHDSDRDRANHTGTQLASTIFDFTEAAQDSVGAMVGASLVYVDGTPLLGRAALTGDVTAAQDGNATTIALNAVTNAKMAQMATLTIKGNNTGGTADPIDLTVAQVQTLLKSPEYLFSHYDTVGNIGTGEDDLYSDTIAAGQLTADGDRIEVEYGGTFVSSATATRQIRIYFGGTAIFDTGALTLSLSSAWTAYLSIIRVSSGVVRYMISLTTEGAALAAYTAVGELTGLTLANTNVLKITGEAAGVGAADDDIRALLGSVIYRPA